MRSHHKVALSAFIATISTLATAHASPLAVDPNARLSLGLNVAYGSDGYHSKDSLKVMPHAFYDNNRWYIEGGEAGFYAYKSKTDHARLGFVYDGQSFDPKDSDYQALDKRKPSILAQVSYTKITPIGGFRLKVAHDALGNHNGTTISLSHISRFQHQKTTVYPSLGLTWYDGNYNDYYYGINTQESVRSGIAPHQVKASISPFVSLMANHALNHRFDVFVQGRAEWLSDKQKQSPITDDDIATTLRLGLGYKFD